MWLGVNAIRGRRGQISRRARSRGDVRHRRPARVPITGRRWPIRKEATLASTLLEAARDPQPEATRHRFKILNGQEHACMPASAPLLRRRCTSVRAPKIEITR